MGKNTFFKYIDYFAAPSRVSDNLTHMRLVSKFWEIGKQYSPRRDAIGVGSQKFHQKWGGAKA